MATHPLPEPAAFRYAPYIGELHEFFDQCGLPYGAPEDIAGLTAKLAESATFSEDLGSLVRSMVLREGGAMPRAQLLEVLALAIGGPAMERMPQDYKQPLLQLLAFVGEVMRRPWNQAPGERAAILPFPAESAPSGEATPLPPEEAPTPLPPEEAPAPHPLPGSAIASALAESKRMTPPKQSWLPDPPMQPRTEPEIAAVPLAAAVAENPAPPRVSHRSRNLLLGLAGIAAVAIAAAWIVRTRGPAESYRVQPVASDSQTPGTGANPAAPAAVPSSATPPAAAGAAYTPKPSANGELMTPRESRRLRAAHPNWNYPDASAPASARSASSAQPATQPASSAAPATAYAPYPPGQGAEPAAPVARQPMPRDPDGSIVGETLPPALAGAPPSPRRSFFSVSSGVMAANLISAPEPEYPTLARLAHIHGQVILQAVVARDGSVSTTRVLRGSHLLRGAAEDAVRRWRYRPFRVNGRPVDVATIVTVDFH